jgi:putative sterol carrier protein
MSSVVENAVKALNEKMTSGFAGSAKVVISGEGALMLDSTGARVGDEAADVTLTASAETFLGILDGSVNPHRSLQMLPKRRRACRRIG